MAPGSAMFSSISRFISATKRTRACARVQAYASAGSWRTQVYIPACATVKQAIQDLIAAGTEPRSPARKEIDFVSPALAGVAIECKYVEDGKWRGEAATVKASQWEGILCTRNVMDLDSDPAWAVPAAVLAYTIDT